ncbi:hypothetical protein [Mucilaginibacter terrae]|uniref:Uncharacterized protein n=1 Tax=Mucilaginibacter terrae TaxID=1955052 RepID=A0ABU3GVV8_9SPHI|nr:hypothetical protein [Mucilaginibacter terrae]MDT3403736.1 hypothetical protein [Mucilaginibacter terrae]
MKNDYFYQAYLEIVLVSTNTILGFINISHISYEKFEIIFSNQINNERFLFDDSMSYFIGEDLYKEHKEFLDEAIPFKFNFDLFSYSVSLTGDSMENYVKDYYTELPQPFEK